MRDKELFGKLEAHNEIAKIAGTPQCFVSASLTFVSRLPGWTRSYEIIDEDLNAMFYCYDRFVAAVQGEYSSKIYRILGERELSYDPIRNCYAIHGEDIRIRFDVLPSLSGKSAKRKEIENEKENVL